MHGHERSDAGEVRVTSSGARDAVHFVASAHQLLREIGTVLSGHTGDEHARHQTSCALGEAGEDRSRARSASTIMRTSS
ncbi:MAG TPA: hypothetical protein VGO62_18110, partial [Myxococcota bacterium]